MKTRSRKNLARLFFVCGIYGTLIGAFYTFENWRWERAWEKYRAERKQQGVWYDDLASSAPVPVPDPQNVATTPLLKKLHSVPHDAVRTQRVFQISREFAGVGSYGVLRSLRGDSWRGKRVDLRGLQVLLRGETNFSDLSDSYAVKRIAQYRRLVERLGAKSVISTNSPPQSPARDVLSALARFGAELQEIELALERPRCRFPLPFDQGDPNLIRTHHAQALEGLASLFKLRVAAQLAEGETEKAFQDARRLYLLADALQDVPSWYSRFRRCEILDHASGAVWEGMLTQSWNAEQLRFFETASAKIDIFDHFVRDRAWELMYVNFEFMRLGRTRPEDHFFRERGPRTEFDLLLRWAPTGWFRANVLEIARMTDEQAAAAANREPLKNLPSENSVAARWTRSPNQRNWLARALWRGDEHRMLVRVWRSAMHADLTRTACAIERFRLSTGDYPDSIEECVPEFLPEVPKDLADGVSVRYRRSADSPFRLYSIGPNLIDNGGQFPSSNGKQYSGDWVWRYEPRKEDEVPTP